MTKYNLYCLPYAGSSATTIYNKWKNALNNNITVKPLELGGHGTKISLPFENSVEEVIDHYIESIGNEIITTPYGLCGHSMGTILIYELLRKIKNKNLPLPKEVFLSGRYPVDHYYKEKHIHLEKDEVFSKNILEYGGTPKELFENDDLRKLFLPILRNDYKIIETYKFNGKLESFPVGVTFFYSDQDKLVQNIEIAKGWKRITTLEFEMYKLQGNHFFINNKWNDICNIINNKLY